MGHKVSGEAPSAIGRIFAGAREKQIAKREAELNRLRAKQGGENKTASPAPIPNMMAPGGGLVQGQPVSQSMPAPMPGTIGSPKNSGQNRMTLPKTMFSAVLPPTYTNNPMAPGTVAPVTPGMVDATMPVNQAAPKPNQMKIVQ